MPASALLGIPGCYSAYLLLSLESMQSVLLVWRWIQQNIIAQAYPGK